MHDKSLVTITVSDPWESPDENEGRIAFVAHIVGNANGNWLLRLIRPAVFKGVSWRFAIPSPQYVGQSYFDGTNVRDTAASILFVTDEQASSEPFLATFDSQFRPNTPWVTGSVERGISRLISRGEDSFIEPTWKPPSG